MEEKLENLKIELEISIKEYEKKLKLQEQFIQNAGLQKQFQKFIEEKQVEKQEETNLEHRVEYQRSLAEEMNAAAEKEENIDQNHGLDYPEEENENKKQAKLQRRL